jgi:hypothetical protein
VFSLGLVMGTGSTIISKVRRARCLTIFVVLRSLRLSALLPLPQCFARGQVIYDMSSIGLNGRACASPWWPRFPRLQI